jgi:predicted GTPase
MDNFPQTVLATCDEIGHRLQTIDRIARQPAVNNLLERDRLAGDVRRAFNRLRLKVDRVRSSGGAALHVVFLGNFNAGKSSLINALGSVHTDADGKPCEIGRATDILPTDDCISLLQFGESRQSYHQRVEGGEVAVEVFDYPFLRNVVLVDTPGVGNVPREDELINDYLDEVDLLVLVSPATMPLNESDQRLLQTKFDRFPSAVGLIVITRIALECPADGVRIDAVDEVKAKQVEERLRAYMRARFPDHVGRLPMNPPHTQSLWLVDSKCKYNIRELADYLFNRFGREEQSVALRRSLMRDRLGLYARETVEMLVGPLASCVGQASTQLTHLLDELERSAAPLHNSTRTHAEVFVGLLKRKLDTPGSRTAFAPLELPGTEEVREALLVPEAVREAMRTSVAERQRLARETVEAMEGRCFVRHEEKLRLILKDLDALVSDWVEVQSDDHKRALLRAYAERVRTVCERHYQGTLPTTLEKLLAEPTADGTDAATRQRAHQLEGVLAADAIQAEVRRGGDRLLVEMRTALVGDGTAGGPLGETGAARLAERRQAVRERTASWQAKAVRAMDGTPSKRLERLGDEVTGELMEVLRGFAPDFAQNIRTLFDARQSDADRLGLEHRLADLEALDPAELLRHFEEALHPAVQQFLEGCAVEARPVVQEFHDGVRESAAQADASAVQAATRVAEHAAAVVREDQGRAVWNDLLAGLDWRRLTDVNLPRTAEEHRTRLLQNIEMPILEIERSGKAYRRKTREHLRWVLILFGTLPVLLFLALAGWDASQRIEFPWWRTFYSWVPWLLLGMVGGAVAGFVVRLRAAYEILREAQATADEQMQRHALELERHVAESRDNLRRAAAERLVQLRGALREMLAAARKRFGDRVGEFDGWVHTALQEWSQASAAQCERMLSRISEATERLERGGGTHGEAFQRQVHARFLSVTDAFLARHLTARKSHLGSIHELLKQQKAQLDEAARFLTEPPAESALAQLTARPPMP